MRAGVLHAARFVLLAGATVLAFFSGGYFDTARAWAGLVAWGLVVIALLLEPRSLPRSRAAWLAIGGLIAWGGWTLLSIGWAPLAGSAYHAGQIVFLYAGGLLAATMLLRDPAAHRAVEPALAAGALIVIGYGLSERLLPGVLHFARSASAQGRLEQPLTYWNAIGELAAIGFVLSARIVGDETRPPVLRAAAAASTVPLGLGLYLSFSRGALFACAAGLVALVVAAPQRAQLEALLLAIAGGTLVSLVAAPWGGLTSLTGTLSDRERQGVIVLVALVLIALAAGATARWRLLRVPPTRLQLPRHASWLVLGVLCAGLALTIVVGAHETSRTPVSSSASRYARLESNRYAYWRVALRAFAAEPVRGVGAGGWAVWWLRYRNINDFAQDAHSLPLQTLAELGLVGIAWLAAFFGGVWIAALSAHRSTPARTAGPIAGFVTYAAHAPLDWDWQMPAVTLVAIVLAGLLLALGQRARMPQDVRREANLTGERATDLLA